MQPTEAFELIESFQREGVRGDSLSYSLLIRACLRARSANDADRALRLMQQEGLQPSVRLYAMVMSAQAQPGEPAASNTPTAPPCTPLHPLAPPCTPLHH